MPVNGLPCGLEMLLEQLNKQDVLQSWQIYEQRNGSICVKLRYSGKPSHDGDHSGVTDMERPQQASYKRISEKQTLRNKSRAEQFQSTKKAKCDGVTTRSKTRHEDGIECPRGQEDSPSTGMECDLNCLSLINTPETVDYAGSITSHTPLLSPSTSELLACSSAEERVDNIHLTPEPPKPPKPDTSSSTIKDSSLNQQNIHDITNSSKQTKRECHYISNGRNHSSEYYKCKACKVYICTSCTMSPVLHKDCFKGTKIDRKKTYR